MMVVLVVTWTFYSGCIRCKIDEMSIFTFLSSVAVDANGASSSCRTLICVGHSMGSPLKSEHGQRLERSLLLDQWVRT